MKKRQKILFVAAVFLIAFAVCFYSRHLSKPRIIGNLPDADVKKIQTLVWTDVKKTEKPRLELDSFKYPKYLFESFTRYERLRVLWIRVEDPNYVRVVVAFNTNTVGGDGWDFMVKRESSFEPWYIAGTAYWGDPAVAPSDFQMP
jgi:hypothetical protein